MDQLPRNISHARQPGHFIGTDDEGVAWFIRRIGTTYWMRRLNEPLRSEFRSLAACAERIARPY